MYTVYICKCIMCIIRSRYAGKTRAEAVLLCPLRSIADPADPSNHIAVATPAHRDWELTRRPNLDWLQSLRGQIDRAYTRAPRVQKPASLDLATRLTVILTVITAVITAVIRERDLFLSVIHYSHCSLNEIFENVKKTEMYNSHACMIFYSKIKTTIEVSMVLLGAQL